MTIVELIHKLSAFNGALEVRLADSKGQINEVGDVADADALTTDDAGNPEFVVIVWPA
jgi:hypothetical protein